MRSACNDDLLEVELTYVASYAVPTKLRGSCQRSSLSVMKSVDAIVLAALQFRATCILASSKKDHKMREI